MDVTFNSPLNETQLNLNKILKLKGRQDLCQKYISEKRCEYQLNKLSPQLPSAFEIRKDVTKQYYDKAPPYYKNAYGRVQQTAFEKQYLYQYPANYPQIDYCNDRMIHMNLQDHYNQYNQHSYQ